MIGLAKRVGARVLIASTSEVYGDPTQHPQTETYWGNVNPIGSIFLQNILIFELLKKKSSINYFFGILNCLKF